MSACMPAMIGEPNEVPPAPDHAPGSVPQAAPPPATSDQQKTWKWLQSPSAANTDTSGVSRTPSFGLPSTACHAGFAHPPHEPLTTPAAEGVPVAHWLGPPPPAAVVMNRDPKSGSLHRLVGP